VNASNEDPQRAAARRKRIALRTFSFFALPFGLFFTILPQDEIDRSKEASDWQPEQADIRVVEERHSAKRAPGDIASFNIHVEGTLTRTGRDFATDRYSFGGVLSQGDIRGYRETVEANPEQTVWVHPEDPSQVVLVAPRTPWAMYAMQVVGVGCFAIVPLVWWRTRRVDGGPELDSRPGA
jgi:hypothetical protein